MERWPLLGRKGVMTPPFFFSFFFGGGGVGEGTACLLCQGILIVTYNGD